MSSDPIIGKKLGDYLIVDMLGQGGMARVYRGLDKKLNRYAAVKVIDASSIRDDEADEYRQRFQNEARAIGRLSHPNIVSIYQYDQIDSLYYMAMNFIEGKDLRSILKTHDKNGTHMNGSEILRIMRDIGVALDYAHSEGVIHRDIKPSNIMVTSSGKAILTDFGLALSVSDGTIGNTFGSAHYIAPEQAVSSAQAVPQSDIYSLGIVLFEMLTNRVPFDDPSAMVVAMKHLTDPPPPPSRINPDLAPEVDKLVVRALDKDPKKRYLNCAELIAHLEKALAISDDVVLEMLNLVIKPPATPPMPAASKSVSPVSVNTLRVSTTQTKGGAETQPVAIMDDTPTVTGPKPTATRPFLEAGSGWGRRLIPVAVIAVAIVVGVFLLSQNSQQVTTNELATMTGVSTQGAQTIQTTDTLIALAAQATDPSEPTSSNTLVPPRATVEEIVPTIPLPATVETAATDIPTTSPQQPALTTDLPATNTPDRIPTATDNPPTPSITSVAVAADAPIVLRYDDQVITVFNQSDRNVDMSNLLFVQTAADGSQSEFESNDWSQDSKRPVTSLAGGDCLQVSRIDRFLSTTDIRPDYCNFVQGWRKIAVRKLFWISTDANATFEVRRGSTVLAVCSIAAGECGLDTGNRK